jgi:glycosyltransferase involved in cell wall biosynthesis
VFAQPDNYEDFANKLLWVIGHYEEAKRIGDAGRTLIDTDFSIQTQTKKAIDFMERVSNPNI